MKKFTSLLVLIFVFTSFTHAQTDASYSATLKKMFDASGSSETFQTVISQIFTTFKQRTGDANSAFFDEFEKEFLKASINDLVEMLVPVYQKYLTQKDLEKMIKFYKTPTGKKYAKSNPLITKESMQIGQQWGMKMGQEIMQKLKEKDKQ